MRETNGPVLRTCAFKAKRTHSLPHTGLQIDGDASAL